MVKKIIGYLLIILGLIILAISIISDLKEPLKIPEEITDIYLMIGAAVLLIIGAFLSFRKQVPKKISEVPIYQGQHIVGYRRN